MPPLGLDPGTLKYTSTKFLLKLKEGLKLRQSVCDELVSAIDRSDGGSKS